MATTYRHCGDRAVVFFNDELTPDAAVDLVDTCDLVIRTYFYEVVEIRIASNGGATEALDYYLAARERWRADGVRVVTRVVSRAYSAGALMVSLADERIADPAARLLYHPVRMFPEGAVTTSRSAAMHAELLRLEAQHINLLVDRAFDGAPSRPPLIAEAECSDHRVLELLGPALVSSDARPPESLRGLVRLLARAVQRAVRARDPRALGRLYCALFELELPISARLARTLRLLDVVGSPAPEPVSAPPWISIPQWSALYPPHGDVPRETLVRHLLATGETGSGKSASVILPVVRAIVRAPPDRVSASLVIDPKHEIGPMLERLAPDRVQRVLPRETGLVLMAGPKWSIDADLAQGRWLTAATKIMVRLVSFVPTSPARVLVDHEPMGSNAEFFDREGTSLLLTVLAFVLMVTHRASPPPEQWLAPDAEACAWLRALLDRANGTQGARGPNALALTAHALEGPLVELPSGSPRWAPDDDSPAPRGWLFARLARAALDVWGGAPGEARQLIERVRHYWLPMVDIDRQYAGVLATARAACTDLAEPHVASSLYVGCEPGARGAGAGACDFAGAVSPDCDGRVLLFQPSRDGLDTVVTKALKALFFEAVFDDPARASGAPDLPLLAYVADEFHRFASSDWGHGEASLLDRCRSYGVFCVLAAQSMASIEHAFAHGGGTAEQDRTAASILWNNTGSKLFFRSTDPRTAQRVEDLCPGRPGLAPVTQVRPLSTLSAGECYACLPDGRFERRQLEPVVAPVPARSACARPHPRAVTP